MLVQTIKSEFKVGSKDLIKCIKKLMDYPIQPLKRTSILSLFPTKTEIEQQIEIVDPKAASQPKSTTVKKIIKYKTDKKPLAKNRFVVSNSNCNIF
jgi:hypothetical protein